VNLERSGGDRPAPSTWEHPAVRLALATRDLASVFRRLSRQGFSQRRIAACTGQNPSEVYEICKGRTVMAYDLLVRIAEGLGIPRGYMGLAHEAELQSPIAAAVTAGACGSNEVEEIRQLLSHAANVTMGVSLEEASRWWQPFDHGSTPIPDRVDETDVIQLEHITRVHRALDYQHGGGACRDAVVAQANYARLLLTASCTDDVRRRLQLALADLHNLAGWTSFDVGLHSAARRHFAQALNQAKDGDDPSLVANVLYRLGRVHLHQQYLSQAMRFFQLGQLAAQDAEDPLTVAMLHANEAWTLALMGNRRKALSSIGRAQDEFSRGRPDGLPGWVSFFGAADLHALIGMVHGLLPPEQGDQQADAITHLTHSIELRTGGMERSLTFELTALATVRLNAGDLALGVAEGRRAVNLAETVRSVRTVDRLEPLRVAAERHPNDSGAAELVHRIATLRTG